MEHNRLYHGDCLQLMREIPDESIDMILCDLPYGVLGRNNEHTKWDSMIPFEPLWEQYKRITKSNAAIVLFGQGMFTARLMLSQPKMWRYNLVWNKVTRPTGFLNAKTRPLRIHEDICVFYEKLPPYNPQFTYGKENHSRGCKGTYINRAYGTYSLVQTELTTKKYPRSIVNIPKVSKDIVHPTQKPVELCRWLIRTYTNSGVVLDNCAGSGSTLIAAIEEKRDWIGIEMSDHFFEICQRRVSDRLRQPTLF